jgi:hypothetical protein
MARSEYKDNTERFAATELHTMRVKIDRERRQESDQDTREALRTSGTEFLRDRQ